MLFTLSLGKNGVLSSFPPHDFLSLYSPMQASTMNDPTPGIKPRIFREHVPTQFNLKKTGIQHDSTSNHKNSPSLTDTNFVQVSMKMCCWCCYYWSSLKSCCCWLQSWSLLSGSPGGCLIQCGAPVYDIAKENLGNHRTMWL